MRSDSIEIEGKFLEARFYNSAPVGCPFATWPYRDYWLEILKEC